MHGSYHPIVLVCLPSFCLRMMGRGLELEWGWFDARAGRCHGHTTTTSHPGDQLVQGSRRHICPAASTSTFIFRSGVLFSIEFASPTGDGGQASHLSSSSVRCPYLLGNAHRFPCWAWPGCAVTWASTIVGFQRCHFADTSLYFFLLFLLIFRIPVSSSWTLLLGQENVRGPNYLNPPCVISLSKKKVYWILKKKSIELSS
jgi:hypothetical protein